MKDTFRKLWGILLICICVVSTSLTSLATDSASEYIGLSGPTEQFVEICKKFFETNRGEYRAIDHDGNDITDIFYNRYQLAYKLGEYVSIWDGVANELSAISWRKETQERVARANLIKVTVSDDFYVVGTTKTHMAGKRFEMAYQVKGTYQFVDATGEIRFYDDDPELHILSFQAGSGFSYDRFNESRKATKINSRRVDFTVRFSIHLNCILAIPWVEDFGPYTGTVTGYGEVI